MANNIIQTIIGLKDETVSGLKGFTTNINGVKDGLQSLAIKAGLTGAAVTGAMTLMVRSSVMYGEEINKLAERSGVAAEAMSKLGYVADIQESSIQELGMAFKFLDKATTSALKGTGDAAEAYKKMGISVRDTSGNIKSSDVVFEEVIANYAKLGSEAEKTAASMTLFGRAGYNMKPLLNTGKEALIQLKEEAVKLGIVLSDQQTRNLDTLGDELTKLKKGYLGVANTLTAMFIPQILSGVVAIKLVYMEVVSWIKRHEELTKSMITVVAVIGTALLAFSAIAGAIVGIISILATATLAWTTLKTAIGLIQSPIGIAVAGVLLVMAVIAEWIIILYVCRDDIKTIFNWIGEIIYNTLAGTGKAIIGWGTDALNYFSNFGATLRSSISTIVEWLADKLGFVPGLGNMMKRVLLGMRDDTGTVADAISDKIGGLSNSVKGYFKDYKSDLSTVSSAVKDMAAEMGTAMLSPFEGGIGKVKSFLSRIDGEVGVLLSATTEKASKSASDVTEIEIKRMERSLSNLREFYAQQLQMVGLSDEDKIALLNESAKSEISLVEKINAARKVGAEETAWATEDIANKSSKNIYEIEVEYINKRITAMQQFTDSTRDIYGQISQVALDAVTGIADGFGTSVATMMRKGDDFGKMMQKVFNSMTDKIVATIVSMVARVIIEESILFKVIMAYEKAKAAAKAVGAHASIPWVGIAIGIAQAAVATAFISQLAKFGDGGIVNGPTLALVGEKGPERITPLAKENNSKSSSSSGNTFNIIVNADKSAGTLRDIIEAARSGTYEAIEASLALTRLADANKGLA